MYLHRETMTSPNATFKIDGTPVIGSTITDLYDLDNGQRDQFYDYSRLVGKADLLLLHINYLLFLIDLLIY